MDASLAVARARSRSRVGRKRERSLGPSAMEIDGGAEGDGDVSMAPPKKRIHSSKSRCAPGHWFCMCVSPTQMLWRAQELQRAHAAAHGLWGPVHRWTGFREALQQASLL